MVVKTTSTKQNERSKVNCIVLTWGKLDKMFS